jgi:hypothetical protein
MGDVSHVERRVSLPLPVCTILVVYALVSRPSEIEYVPRGWSVQCSQQHVNRPFDARPSRDLLGGF